MSAAASRALPACTECRTRPFAARTSSLAGVHPAAGGPTRAYGPAARGPAVRRDLAGQPMAVFPAPPHRAPAVAARGPVPGGFGCTVRRPFAVCRRFAYRTSWSGQKARLANGSPRCSVPGAAPARSGLLPDRQGQLPARTLRWVFLYAPGKRRRGGDDRGEPVDFATFQVEPR